MSYLSGPARLPQHGSAGRDHTPLPVRPAAVVAHWYRRWSILPLVALAGGLLHGQPVVKARPLPSRSPATLSTVQQLQQLSRAEARRGYGVHLAGVVTYSDPADSVVYVQDGTGGIPVNTGAQPPPVRVGQAVEVDGVTGPDARGARIAEPRFRAVGTTALPEAPLSPLVELARRPPTAKRVTAEGIVGSSEEHQAHAVLQLGENAARLSVVVLGISMRQAAELLGARVRAQGVWARDQGQPAAGTGARLLVPGLDYVTVVAPAPTLQFTRPAVPIATLGRRSNSATADALVHVRGVVLPVKVPHGVRLADASGAVEALSLLDVALPPDTVVDAVGRPALGPRGPTLEASWFRRVGLGKAVLDYPTSQATALSASGERLPLLRRAEQIRALSPKEAQRGYPVRLQGVITYYDPRWNMLFFQEATSGIYVDCWGVTLDLHSGDRAVLRGYSAPGRYAPSVSQPQFELEGTAPLPVAPERSREEMLSGSFDSQWLATRGVVCALTNVDDHLYVTLDTGKGRFNAVLPNFEDQALPTHLLDAEVRVTGVCGSLFNQQGQFLGLQLYLPTLDRLQIVEPAPGDPFADALEPIGDLLRFSPIAGGTHRRRVRGVITLRRPDGSFYLQDASGGVRSFPQRPILLRVGDLVEVAGFPATGQYTPVLREALVKKVGQAPLPPPVAITPAQALGYVAQERVYDGQRVRLTGRVLDKRQEAQRQTLALQNGEIVFEVVCEPRNSAQGSVWPRRNSLLQVQGVCVVQVDDSRQPRAFQVLLRSPADVVVLSAPSWWTTDRLEQVLWFSALGALAGLAWLLTLHIRVRHQTAVIGQRLAREAALEKRYQELFENANDLFFTTDAAGRLTSVNRAVERVLGYGRTALLGAPLSRFATLEARPRAEEIASLQAGAERPSTLEVLAHDGRRVTLELSTRLITQGSQPVGLQAVARDISDRLSLEAKLRHAQRLESVGQLAAGVAHDFNNILNVILGYASLLLARPSLAPELIEPLREISNAAERAANLTRQLLTFSLKQLTQPEVLDLGALTENLLRMLRRLLGEHITLRFERPQTLAPLRADRGMMEQILLNLAVNARDAMPKGGELSLELSTVELKPDATRGNPEARPGTFVRLAMRDTGCGMDREVLSHLFEPFFTTKGVGKGTGLGLATVYGIVKQHQGWIEVASEVGRGSLFTVYLPPHLGAPAPPGPTQSPADGPRGNGETLLLVEDEPALRMLAERVLLGHGYQVLAASTGQEAMQTWSTHGAEIDLLVTDVVMPGGISGTELADRLQTLNPALKVVCTSGYSLEMLAREPQTRQGLRLLPKPYSPTTLLLTVRECLDD